MLTANHFCVGRGLSLSAGKAVGARKPGAHANTNAPRNASARGYYANESGIRWGGAHAIHHESGSNNFMNALDATVGACCEEVLDRAIGYKAPDRKSQEKRAATKEQLQMETNR